MSELPATTSIPELSGGDFSRLVKDLSLPPLPAAVSKLIAEINRPDPDMEELIEVLSTCPETAAKVLQTINSSVFALRHPVVSVRHAAALLGLRHIRPIALSFAVAGALPHPQEELFDHDGFWSDALIRAMFARAFASRCSPGERDVVFTGALLADLAIPVLLLVWTNAYGAIPARWRTDAPRLSELERQAYGWDHGEAGAHIMEAWGLPRELRQMVAMHTWNVNDIRDRDGAETGIVVATAALVPSVQRPHAARAEQFVQEAMTQFDMDAAEMVATIAQIRAEFEEICMLFGVKGKRAFSALDELVITASRKGELPAASPAASAAA